MLLLAVKNWCSKHQRTIAIGKTGSLCGPFVYLMFLEATKNKLVRKYVPVFFFGGGEGPGFQLFLEPTKTTQGRFWLKHHFGMKGLGKTVNLNMVFVQGLKDSWIK